MTEEKDQPIRKAKVKNMICPHHGMVLHAKKDKLFYECLICFVAQKIRAKQRIIEGEKNVRRYSKRNSGYHR